MNQNVAKRTAMIGNATLWRKPRPTIAVALKARSAIAMTAPKIFCFNVFDRAVFKTST